MLGECKWGLGEVNRQVIRTLIEKAPLVLPEADWQVHFAYFARAGFTDAAREEASGVNAILITLPQLDSDLRRDLLAQK